MEKDKILFATKATTQSFMRLYEENCKFSKNYRQAYELTEELHNANFGSEKYSGYSSFRVARTRFVNKRN